MKIKLLLALVLNLATIGLSLPALAGNDDNWNRQDSDRYNRRVEHQDTKSSQYYGNYYPYNPHSALQFLRQILRSIYYSFEK